MFNLLMLGSGLLWTVAYLLIIRQGFRDRTYGMPLVALCANLSWEFIFAVVHPHGMPQRAVNFVWFGFDLLIAWQLLRFGPSEWDLEPWAFRSLFGLSLVLAFGGVLLVTYEFENWSGAYAAFGQNLMMSALFIDMFRRRHNLRGQSSAIAACKLGGTLLASLAFYFLTETGATSRLLQYCFVSIFVLDLFYLLLVVRATRRPQRSGRPA